MIRRVNIQITAPVYETEVVDRVETAIRNLFPDAEITHHDDEVVATARSMDELATRLRDQKILDTAREQFLKSRREDSFSFSLKKQAAFIGVVNFAVGSADELGELTVQVRVDQPDVDSYIDHIAPPTADGEPVDN